MLKARCSAVGVPNSSVTCQVLLPKEYAPSSAHLLLRSTVARRPALPPVSYSVRKPSPKSKKLRSPLSSDPAPKTVMRALGSCACRLADKTRNNPTHNCFLATETLRNRPPNFQQLRSRAELLKLSGRRTFSVKFPTRN